MKIRNGYPSKNNCHTVTGLHMHSLYKALVFSIIVGLAFQFQLFQSFFEMVLFILFPMYSIYSIFIIK